MGGDGEGGGDCEGGLAAAEWGGMGREEAEVMKARVTIRRCMAAVVRLLARLVSQTEEEHGDEDMYAYANVHAVVGGDAAVSVGGGVGGGD